MGEFPLLKSLQQEFGGRGLELVGVSLDKDCGKALETARTHGLSWPQLCDGKALEGEVFRLYNTDVTPTYYVIGRDGSIAGKKVEAEALRGIVEKALAAAPPKPAVD